MINKLKINTKIRKYSQSVLSCDHGSPITVLFLYLDGLGDISKSIIEGDTEEFDE